MHLRYFISVLPWLLACGVAGNLFAQVPAAPVVALEAGDALSLRRAQELQRDNNRAIRAAVRQAEIAGAEVYRVNVRPNPTLTGQVSNTEPNRYRPGATNRLVRLDQLFERGGKRELRTRQAQLLEQASKWDLADVSRQQRSQLATGYFDLVAAQELLNLASENLTGYQRLQAAAERRQSAGDLAAIEVSRLRVEASRAANELRSAQSQRLQAQLALALLIGQETSAAKMIAGDPLPLQSAIAEINTKVDLNSPSLEADSQNRRADILAAQSRVDAAQQSIELAQSLRARDVSIGLQTERSPSLGGHVFGISATIPLFVNNDFAGDVARAKAEKDAAEEDRDRLKALARSELDRALSQLRAAADRANRLLSSTLADAAKVVSGIEFAFANGAATLTDLFDSRRQRAAVRAEAIGAQADFAKAFANYEAASTLESSP